MSYIFYSPISRTFEEIDEMLAWAKTHCTSYITNDSEKRSGDWYYRFYFGEEQDLSLFTLRWS